MLCQKNEPYFTLAESAGGEEEGGRAEKEAAISSSSAGEKKRGLSPPARATEHRAFVTCWGLLRYLLADLAGTSLMGQP